MAACAKPVYLDAARPLGERVADLLGRMTPAEKVSQLLHTAPAIERLGVPAYNWWNECLHGVGRAGRATVFPQAIGMAASFDPELMLQVGTAISDEARPSTTRPCARGAMPGTSASLSGVRTSTCSATRAGGGARRPMGKTPT